MAGNQADAGLPIGSEVLVLLMPTVYGCQAFDASGFSLILKLNRRA